MSRPPDSRPPGPNVVVTFPVPEEMREAIREELRAVARMVFVHDLPEAERPAALERADALLAWNPWRELDPSLIPSLGRAPFMQLLPAGADQVRFGDLPESMTLASNVGAYAEPIAEHAVAMMLALGKRLPQRHAALAGGSFDQWERTMEVDGSVLGVLGFGGIGKATARRMQALGARIHAINTSGRTEEPVEFVGTLDDLDAVLGAADFLLIALPLTKETRGLIGRRELDLMKPAAVLVNVARGSIVEEEALYAHLKAHPGFGAGLDAWWDEPRGTAPFRTRFPFFELQNLIGSPHNSALVPGIELHAVRMAARNVARRLGGQPVTGIVLREDYEG